MRALALLTSIPLLAACAGGGKDGQDTFMASSNGDDVGSSDDSGTADSTSATDDVDSSSDSSDSSSSDSSSSDSSDSSSDSSTETGEPACERKRYTLNLNTNSWSAVALDQAWAGANAPPCAVGIAAATLIGAWSELIVVGEDEMIYRRLDGVWQTPLPWSQSFAALVGETPTAASHTPSVADPSKVDLFFSLADGRAIIYDYNDNGGAVLVDIVDLMDNEPPGAPQASEQVRWVVTLADVALSPEPDWLIWYMNYSDGFSYTFNAAFEWTQSPEGSPPYFGTGQADEPVPALIEAAYGDLKMMRAYLIGP